MKEKVTLETIEKQFELNPKVILQHLDFLKAFTIFTECLNVDESTFKTIRSSLPNYEFLRHRLNETYMIFIGVKKNHVISEANIEYLWVKFTNDPIYYEVYLENIRLLKYIHPPVVNIGETHYRIHHPNGEVFHSGDFIHVLAEMQSHLVPNFYHYKIQKISTFAKIRRRKDKLYFNIQPVITLEYEDIQRRDILSLFETFGQLAKLYKKYNKE